MSCIVCSYCSLLETFLDKPVLEVVNLINTTLQFIQTEIRTNMFPLIPPGYIIEEEVY